MKGKWIGLAAVCAALGPSATAGAFPPPLALYVRQFGSSNAEIAYGVGVDAAGNSYITGTTGGDLAGPNLGGGDAFIVACNSAWGTQWTRQIGTTDDDRARGIAVDSSGNSYIGGWTRGDLGGPNQGDYDAFIAKCDSGGTVQWIRQIGTSEYDTATGIAVDGSGNCYISGYTEGDLAGPGHNEDAFFLACNSDGTVQWARQFGTSESDIARGVAVDGSGNCYITGSTRGNLGGANQGTNDVFIAFAVGHATPGDANLDTCPDGLDYIIWSNNYGLSDRWWRHGDFSGDGVVDGLDYLAWSSNYKQNCLGQVPEPGSLALLALGALALLRRKRGYGA